MDFSSRQLRAFHLVARHRSFARAAEELLITPSGLSVLIRELERQLGFRLFDRTTRQVTLTAFGSELIAVTEPSLSTLHVAMSRIQQPAFGRSMLSTPRHFQRSSTATAKPAQSVGYWEWRVYEGPCRVGASSNNRIS